jgi:OOP family OmpA-OmpF porin
VNNTKKIALAVALLCCAGTSLAQEINPSWYVQPSVVGIKTDPDFGVDEKDWGGGLKFGKPVSPMWDIQVGATHARADSGRNNYHQTLLGVDALLMLSRKNFRPYVLFGLGAERDKVAVRRARRRLPGRPERPLVAPGRRAHRARLPAPRRGLRL